MYAKTSDIFANLENEAPRSVVLVEKSGASEILRPYSLESPEPHIVIRAIKKSASHRTNKHSINHVRDIDS